MTRECESAHSNTMGVAIIQGVTFLRKAVTYHIVNGRALVEGDICIGTVAEVQDQIILKTALTPFGAAAAAARLRWPGGLIPYDIHDALPNKARILDAMAHWEDKTSIRFPRRTQAHQDFLAFIDDGGDCSSHVGRKGGRQEVSIGANCNIGSVIHELGHAVGLWHEQSREDRDLFVRVNWDNVLPGSKSQFNQRISDGDDVGDYDYGSIMHYGPKQFSKNGNDTLTPLAAGVTIGQRTGLSDGDIAAVEKLYGQER